MLNVSLCFTVCLCLITQFTLCRLLKWDAPFEVLLLFLVFFKLIDRLQRFGSRSTQDFFVSGEHTLSFFALVSPALNSLLTSYFFQPESLVCTFFFLVVSHTSIYFITDSRAGGEHQLNTKHFPRCHDSLTGCNSSLCHKNREAIHEHAKHSDIDPPYPQ